MHTTEVPELLFEWDGAKNRANERKHGVSFEEAQRSSMTTGRFWLRMMTLTNQKSDSCFWE